MKSLRITLATYDDDITELIEAAKKEMDMAGIKVIDDTDEYTARAIKVFVKANLGLDPKNADKFIQTFEKMVCRMANAQEYAEEAGV